MNGKASFVYSWRLEPTDKLPVGKKPCLSLREMEKQIGYDLDTMIDPQRKNITVMEFVERYLKTKTGAKPQTKTNYNFVRNILLKEAFSGRKIGTVKTSDTEEELRAVAELWYRVGWRDYVVSGEEIACTGCTSHKQCTYRLVECTKEHQVKKCNQCAAFPCEKIQDMLRRSSEYQEKCREVCSEAEYAMLEQAFFEK